MKYLCLDYGEKRTGIAVSDPSGGMVFPRKALFKRTREEFFCELVSLIQSENPDCIVVGLPVRGDGTDSLTTRQARNFAQSLKRRVELPICLMEETLSSEEAEAMLRESGQRFTAKDGIVDCLAAMRILESFISDPDHAEEL